MKQIHALHKQHDGNHPSQRKESGGGAGEDVQSSYETPKIASIQEDEAGLFQ